MFIHTADVFECKPEEDENFEKTEEDAKLRKPEDVKLKQSLRRNSELRKLEDANLKRTQS